MRALDATGTLAKCFVGSKLSRYEARHRVLSGFAKMSNLRVYNKHTSWYLNDEYARVWNEYAESDGVPNDRRFHLYHMAKSVQTVPGDTVECGVFRGAGSYAILRGFADNANRAHHIFDSFEGLSKPEAEDQVDNPQTFKWEGEEFATPEHVVKDNLKDFPNTHLYKGWIPERFDEVKDKTFAFIHIDVDLYQPTLDSLAFFYPRCNPGALLVCDDYGSDACPGAFKAVNEFFADKPEGVMYLTTGQSVVVKR